MTRARLDITKTDVDYPSGEDDRQAQVATLAQLLRSGISLPASEVPTSRLTGELALSGPGSRPKLGSTQW